MRSQIMVALTSLLAAGCSTSPTPERRTIEAAAVALGGVDRIRAVQTLSLEGTGLIFALGQNRTLTGPLLRWEVSQYHRSIDFEHQQWREESVQKPTFVTGWPAAFTTVLGYDRGRAYDVEDGTARRMDSLVARDRRAEFFHHPIGFLRAAIEEEARLENARQVGSDQAVDLVLAGNDRFTLVIDRKSKLPVRIFSTSHEPALGDVLFVTEFSEFSPVAGLEVPGQITRKIDTTTVASFRIKKAVINPAVGALDAPAEATTPAAPGSNVTIAPVARGIWYLAGEGHHSVVIEFADHLTLVEAPVNDTRTLAVITAARALRPGKPLTEVINTHHHFDHSGGLRAAISEGLTVITHESNRPFVEAVAARPSTVARDALARHPRALSIETLTDTKVLTDGARRVEIYLIEGSAHSASLLMVYVPAEGLLVEADVYQPPPLQGEPPVAHPFAANLLDNIERRNLRVERVLPIHGRVVPFGDLVAAARGPATGGF